MSLVLRGRKIVSKFITSLNLNSWIDFDEVYEVRADTVDRQKYYFYFEKNVLFILKLIIMSLIKFTNIIFTNKTHNSFTLNFKNTNNKTLKLIHNSTAIG